MYEWEASQKEITQNKKQNNKHNKNGNEEKYGMKL